MTSAASTASTLQLLGAGAFGTLIGWYVYYINRYRKEDVHLADIVTLLGAIGGSAVLTLFDKKTDLFGAYGIGLFVGFFGYFLTLLLFVVISSWKEGSFTLEWFLDGRRKNPPDGWGYPGGGTGPSQRPLSVDTTDHPVGR